MLIDSHCHLPHKKYNKSVSKIMEEAKEAGVEKVITIGTNLKNNQTAMEHALNYTDLYACIGIYPQDERNQPIQTLLEQLDKQIEAAKVSRKLVGIGECGIDITEWENQRSLEEQIQLFEGQIELAIKHSLPIVIHNRNGDEHIVNSLKKYSDKNISGVIHCFVSNWDFAKKALELNFYISFSGIITYKSGESIHETVKNVPLDKFLVETDAPYLSPEGFRKEINEPKYVKITTQKVAELKQIPQKDAEDYSYKNTCRLFDIPTSRESFLESQVK